MNFRWICNNIWDIKCERILCWINERVTYINNIPCIIQNDGNEENNFILMKYKIPFLNIFTSSSKFICCPYSIYPYRPCTIWISKFVMTITTTVTLAVFIKLTCRFVILVFCPCSCWPSWSVYARVAIFCWVEISCKQKGVLEEMLILFHNILTKK